jgi:hypothetical protein
MGSTTGIMGDGDVGLFPEPFAEEKYRVPLPKKLVIA